MTNTSQNNEQHVNSNETSLNAGFHSFTTPTNERFYKAERLKSATKISKVFAEGMSLANYPILLYYRTQIPTQKQCFAAQAAFTVSKKHFKRAVDRNRIKRLMREAYRLKKQSFYQNHSKPLQYHLVFIYIGKEIETYAKIEGSIQKILAKLVSE